MYHDLYEYLVLNKQVSIQGVGTFKIERKPAATDFAHKQVAPPTYSISFNHTNETPVKRFFYWLSDKWNIPYSEAVVRYNGFSIDMKNQLTDGSKVSWNGVGTISKTISGDIRFDPATRQEDLFSPVPAVRVIREKEVHNVKVGEDNRSSLEMASLLQEVKQGYGHWWAPALILTIILLIIAGIYFSQAGFQTGNQKKIAPQKETSTRNILQ